MVALLALFAEAKFAATTSSDASVPVEAPEVGRFQRRNVLNQLAAAVEFHAVPTYSCQGESEDVFTAVVVDSLLNLAPPTEVGEAEAVESTRN